MAFKVFNNRDEVWDQWKAQLLVAALRPCPATSRWAEQCMLPGVCFKCNQMRHWAKHFPSPHPPPGPCPRCGQNGHWKDDCPSLSLQGRSVSHLHSQLSEGLMDLLSLAAGDWYGPGDLSPLQDHLGGAQGNCSSSRYASIIYLVLPDFSGKLYPSQISMVRVNGLIHQPKRKDSFI
jgi:hypothetical protein